MFPMHLSYLQYRAGKSYYIGHFVLFMPAWVLPKSSRCCIFVVDTVDTSNLYNRTYITCWLVYLWMWFHWRIHVMFSYESLTLKSAINQSIHRFIHPYIHQNQPTSLPTRTYLHTNYSRQVVLSNITSNDSFWEQCYAGSCNMVVLYVRFLHKCEVYKIVPILYVV